MQYTMVYIVYVYSTVGWSVSSIYYLGGILPWVVYIGYRPPYHTTDNTYIVW